MQLESGAVVDLKKFKDMLKKHDPECLKAKPVLIDDDTGDVRPPKSSELADFNREMIAAGWNRHERRKYLAQVRKGINPDLDPE
jgi:hypothetical protein